MNDLTGQKFNRLLVLEENGRTKHKEVMWKCLCDCGTIKNITAYPLISGNIKSCGCYNKENQRTRNLKQSGISAAKLAFNQYKYNKKNRSFQLAFDLVYDLFQQNCFYCGSKPKNISKSKYSNGDFIYNGIDRLDSSKSYTSDNVVPCCAVCNFGKSNMSYYEFIGHITKIKNKDLPVRHIISYMYNVTAGVKHPQLREVFSKYRYRAKKKGLDFNLSFDECFCIFNQHCFYCQSSPENVHTDKAKNKLTYYSGIDRINPNLGYNIFNVVSSCKECNRIKSNQTYLEFIERVNDIYRLHAANI